MYKLLGKTYFCGTAKKKRHTFVVGLYKLQSQLNLEMISIEVG
jgi:hypothetical protein